MKFSKVSALALALPLLASSAIAQSPGGGTPGPAVTANAIDVRIGNGWVLNGNPRVSFDSENVFSFSPSGNAAFSGGASICGGVDGTQQLCQGNFAAASGVSNSTGGQLSAKTAQASGLFFNSYSRAAGPGTVMVGTRFVSVTGGPSAPTAAMSLATEITLFIQVMIGGQPISISSTVFVEKLTNSSFVSGTTNGTFVGSVATDSLLVATQASATATISSIAGVSVGATIAQAQAGADIFLMP